MTASLLALVFLTPVQDGLMTGWEAQSGFQPLFDGKSTAGWKGWKRDAPPTAWKTENGELIIRPGSGQGGDISTIKQFGDFDLRLEWKATKGANSGIIYRSAEDYESSWQTGPECQVYDDHAVGAKATPTSAGSLYAMYQPVAFVTRPAGEWNEVRIVAKGNHIEHWLNQVKVVDCEVGSADWNARYDKSKFKAFEQFAKRPKGYILLQDHGAEVAFRRIRLKEL